MNIRRVRNGSRGVLVRTALGRVQTGKSLACCWKDGKTVSRRKQRDFPGGPVVKTSPSNIGVQVRSLVGKLRSHMPCSRKVKEEAGKLLKQECARTRSMM